MLVVFEFDGLRRRERPGARFSGEGAGAAGVALWQCEGEDGLGGFARPPGALGIHDAAEDIGFMARDGGHGGSMPGERAFARCWPERELSVMLYHEILEAAAVASADPPASVMNFNEADFERTAYAMHDELGGASPRI